jgi:hypothetical protein
MKTLLEHIPFWVWFVALYFIIALIGSVLKDNTDPASGRRGMALYTDALTGCQYLATRFSGLTPRLDGDGKQICGAPR